MRRHHVLEPSLSGSLPQFSHHSDLCYGYYRYQLAPSTGNIGCMVPSNIQELINIAREWHISYQMSYSQTIITKTFLKYVLELDTHKIADIVFLFLCTCSLTFRYWFGTNIQSTIYERNPMVTLCYCYNWKVIMLLKDRPDLLHDF